jgi:hypothetical protein
VRGSPVIKGYINRPEATAESITDGWLHTGDIARLDENGFIFIVDRKKDMVLRGGENVYCAEVEGDDLPHPRWRSAACSVCLTTRLGEEVGVAVVLRPGDTLTADELRAHCAGIMAKHKIPRYVWFLDEALPRNASGKFLKRELRRTPPDRAPRFAAIEYSPDVTPRPPLQGAGPGRTSGRETMTYAPATRAFYDADTPHHGAARLPEACTPTPTSVTRLPEVSYGRSIVTDEEVAVIIGPGRAAQRGAHVARPGRARRPADPGRQGDPGARLLRQKRPRARPTTCSASSSSWCSPRTAWHMPFSPSSKVEDRLRYGGARAHNRHMADFCSDRRPADGRGRSIPLDEPLAGHGRAAAGALDQRPGGGVGSPPSEPATAHPPTSTTTRSGDPCCRRPGAGGLARRRQPAAAGRKPG